MNSASIMQFVWHLLQNMLYNILKKNIIFVLHVTRKCQPLCLQCSVQRCTAITTKSCTTLWEIARLKKTTRITLRHKSSSWKNKTLNLQIGLYRKPVFCLNYVWAEGSAVYSWVSAAVAVVASASGGRILEWASSYAGPRSCSWMCPCASLGITGHLAEDAHGLWAKIKPCKLKMETHYSCFEWAICLLCNRI